MATEKRVAEIVQLDRGRAPSGAYAEEFALLRSTPCTEDAQSQNDESATLASPSKKTAQGVKITAGTDPVKKSESKQRPMRLIGSEKLRLRQMQLGLQCLYDSAVALEKELEEIAKSMQVTKEQVSQGSVGYTAARMDVDATMVELASKVRAFKNTAQAAQAKLGAFKL